MLTDVPGVRVGHYTDAAARTGCTVVLFPDGTVASGEVRGGASGTREWDLLRPERLVSRIDACVLTGGSAFGLAACDGVVRWCEERGAGLPTIGGPVPIVVGCVLFDLAVGSPHVRPTADNGYAACESAVAGVFETGPVGAGTGATLGKWRGRDAAVAGGVGTASVHGDDGLVVSALIACNAWGSLRSGPVAIETPREANPWNTTIGVIATNATLDKTACLLVAQSGHDGFARALEPVHALFDGDALVAAATGSLALPAGPASVEIVRWMAASAVEAATRSAAGEV